MLKYTNANGETSWTGLPPGVYIVRERVDLLPAGVSATTSIERTVTVSSGQELVWQQGAAMLQPGAPQTELVVGVQLMFGNQTTPELASLGNFVWNDLNRDGLQTPGEPGVGNITVTLTGAGPDAVLGTPDDTTASNTTSGSGLYSFTGLTPGVQYRITFSNLPTGYVFTQANVGADDTIDSDANPLNGQTQIVILASGEVNNTLDAGMLSGAAINIEKLVRGDPIEPPQSDEICTTHNNPQKLTFIYTGDGPDGTNTSQTPDKYSVTGDPLDDPQVFIRANNSSTPGSTSEVYFSFNVALGGTFLVDAVLGGRTTLPANTFIHIFDTLGGAWLQTAQVHTSCSAPLILGDQWGAVQLIEYLGNGEGTPVEMPDPAPGPGDADADTPPGIPVAPADQVVWTYVVTNPGTYQLANVTVTDDNQTPGVPGDNFSPTPVLADTYNVGDIDKDGRLDPGEAWRYVAWTVSQLGQHVNVGTVVGTPVNNSGTPIGLPNVTDSDPSNWFASDQPSLGNYVWEDLNGNGLQDFTEPGMADITVTLTGGGPNGIIGTGGDDTTQTTFTDAQGNYLFVGLNAGEQYQVTFSDLPSGYEFTVPDAGGDDEIDSDADRLTGMTPIVTLAASEVNLTLDAGIRKPVVRIQKETDSATVPPFQPVTYTYSVFTLGPGSVSNVVVTDDNGTPDVPEDDFNPTFTGGDTNANNLLDPGEVWTYSATRYPVLTLGQTVNGVFTELATMALEELPGGDIRAIFTLSRDINDNAYGTGAVPAGWSSHKFGDLVGSDRAQFAFYNANGTLVWQADVDYISASGAYPSGYGTLGVTGGEGGMIVGNAAHLLAVTTSLTENLNNPPWLGNASVLVNSPPEPNPDWEYHIIHDLTIDSAAFGASGFGSAQVIEMHNSPNKNGYNLVNPTVMSKWVTNLATVQGLVNGSPVADADTETVFVGEMFETKFFVVDNDDADGNPIYRYGLTGTSGPTTAADGKSPRGIASFPDGSRLLVVDQNDKVFAYDPDGGLIGSWTASNLDEARGISTDGTNVWIVDGKQRRVLRYNGAASLISGSASPSSMFNLNNGNDKASDLVTDGTKIWVVDGDDKYVFVYTMTGTLLGSWMPQGTNKPRGITLDPNDPGTIWLVDTGTKSVLRYDNAVNVTGGTVAFSGQFALTADNADPQGIADPPMSSSRSRIVTAQQASEVPELGTLQSSIQALAVATETLPLAEAPAPAAVQPELLQRPERWQRRVHQERQTDSLHESRPAAFLRQVAQRRLAVLVDRAFGEWSARGGGSTDEVFADLASDLREDALWDDLWSQFRAG